MSDERFDSIEKKLDKVDSKIDKIMEHSSSADVTLALNTQSLVTHIKRTELLEKRVEPLEQLGAIATALAKIAIAMAGLTAFVLSVLEIIKLLR